MPSTQSGPLAWRPYQNLLAYHLEREPTFRRAWYEARRLARRAFPGHDISVGTRRPSESALRRTAPLRITPQIESLVFAKRARARQHIDHLTLAYARSGYAPEIALKEMHLDYRSIDGVPPLSEHEICTYAALLWDFLWLPDLRPGLAYLEHHLPGSEELAIYRGKRTLREVRASCLVLRSLTRADFGGEITVQVGAAMERLTQEINRDIADLKSTNRKALKDKAMLLARLSLTQDRMRRSQSVVTGEDDDALGLDELLDSILEGRERRSARSAQVPWQDPADLVRSS